MDLSKSLEKLIVSKTRLKLLRLFFAHPKESFYVREVERLTKEEINSVRRELDILARGGFLISERKGNRMFYSVNSAHPLYQTLLAVIAKIEGIGGKIIKNKSRLGSIKFVVFSGNFLRWENKRSEVDFLIVGKVILPEIGALVVEEERRRGREVNYAVMGLKEFKLRKTSRDPFLLNILLNNPVVIVGNEQELASL
jgi:DNA-binding transcriptional ArsR family regulator